MRVLIACEESQAVCKEFRKLGHEAYSCDIQDCSGGYPEWHIKGDVLEVINEGWDMMVAFPPCTHLAVSGAAWFEEKRKDGRQQEGIDFFMNIINSRIEKIAVENPIGIMSNIYRKPDQIIHPYYFGDAESKSTCLWLKNLPLLFHAKEKDLFNNNITHVEPEYIYTSNGNKYSRIHYLGGGSGKERSKTFPGIAKAMAKQWG
jgi:hypothetical protein